MALKIINAVDNRLVPAWGNKKKYIAVHYLGAVGNSHALSSGGYGTQYYVHHEGDVYQACSEDAVTWQVGTAGYYKQIHPYANNYNCIGIEMCCYCDGNKQSAEDPRWYFTEETQRATVELVRYLMQKHNIPLENVLRHGDIVNKTCPAPYIHNNRYKGTWTWKEFKEAVRTGVYPTGGSMGQKDTKALNDFGIKYEAHCQTIGWCKQVHDGMTAGTEGEGRRLEAFKVDLPEGVTADCKVHVQGIGWKTLKDVGDCSLIGTTGQGKRLEAFEFSSVTGLPEGKKLHYAAHVQGIGWMEATSGYPVGSMGQAKRIEAIKIWCE